MPKNLRVKLKLEVWSSFSLVVKSKMLLRRFEHENLTFHYRVEHDVDLSLMLVWWIVYVVDLSTKLMSMRTLVNLSAMVSKEKNAFLQKIIYYIWDYPAKSKATIQIKKRWLYGLNWMSFFLLLFSGFGFSNSNRLFSREKSDPWKRKKYVTGL